MTYEELVAKQSLAISLYNAANNTISFDSVEENKSLIEESLSSLKSPEVVIVDLKEGRSKEEQILVLFNTKTQTIMNTLGLDPVQQQKSWLLPVNFEH